MSKRILSFRGPAHHGQLMRPVEDQLQKRGFEPVRYTTDTEGCFQAGLNEELGHEGYRWLQDTTDPHQSLKMYSEVADWFQSIYATPNALSTMTPQILDRIVMSVCREYTATKRLVEEVKPSACLVLHELNRWGMLLGYVCQRKGIPVYSFQEGLYYGNEWLYTGHTRYSTSLVWGAATRGKLLRAGCAEERVRVVGHPDLGSRWAKAKETRAAAQAEVESHVGKRRLCLVFFTNVELTQAAENVMAGIPEQEEWGFVARIHQLASVPNIERTRQLFDRKGCWFSDNTHTFGHHWQLMDLAEMLIVVGCSSTFLEWATTGKPMGQVRGSIQFRDFAAEGIAVDVHDMTLLDSVRKIEREWKGEKAAEFARQEICKLDAAEEMAEIIVGG